MHIPWYDLYFHEFWNFFQNYYHTYHYQIFFNTWKKKLKKHRSVIAHILYPCTTFCLTNQTKKNKKIHIDKCLIIGLGESLSASLSSFLFVVAKLFWALSDLLSSFFRRRRFKKPRRLLGSLFLSLYYPFCIVAVFLFKVHQIHDYSKNTNCLN